MSNTYTWKIDWITTIPTEDNLDKIVIRVGWSCYTDDGEYSAKHSGFMQYAPRSDMNDFIPYNQLTEEQLLTWAWNSALHKTTTEEGVQQLLQSKTFLIDHQYPTMDHYDVTPLPWI